MRSKILAALLVASASVAIADPTPKEKLLVPPPGARHYTISSTAGKHGDIWSWTTPDGKAAYRMSMSLRGWVTEDDELITPGADGRPTAIAIRGYTDSGDATEDFNVDPSGVAHWKTVVDSGSGPYGAKRYNTYGGPGLASEKDIEALVAAGDKGIDLLPSGHASIRIGQSVQIDGRKARRRSSWRSSKATASRPIRCGSTARTTSSGTPGSSRFCRRATRAMGPS